MKKTMWGQRLPALLLALVLCLSLLPTAAFAAEEKQYSGEDDGMVWDFDQATGTLTISGTMHEIYFKGDVHNSALGPWQLTGFTWPWRWGGWDKEIVSVVIQDGVTEIPDAARGTSGSTNQNGPFYGCENLTSVTIPNSVTKIGSWAFFDCIGLTGVTIPDSVTSIGEGAFYRCSSLASVTIPNRVTKIGSWAFLSCESLTSVTIPDSVTEIGDGAFEYCDNLSQVELGNSVETIGEQAFWIGAYSRPKITDITLPSSIREADLPGINHVILDDSWTRIGPDVKLTGSYGTLTIPASVTEILSGNLGDMKDIRFMGTLEQWQAISSASGFPEELRDVRVSYSDGNAGLNITGTVLKQYDGDGGDVVIPEGVTEIGYRAFGTVSGGAVTSVTIPDSVEKIGAFAFVGADKLTNVTLPAGLTTIDQSVFRSCESLASITIPASVTTIGREAFAYCKSLTSITLPANVTSIGIRAFNCCENLTSITIPSSVTTIEWEAFAYCESLTSITIPASVTSIGNKAFYGSGLKTICGVPGSYAETYAKQNGYAFQSIGTTDPDPAPNFTDVPRWFAAEVSWAEANGITEGYGNSKFGTNDPCTNAQILTFLWRAAKKPDAKAKSPFTVQSYYQGAVDWAYGEGMIDGSFDPKGSCTRSSAMVYIWQAFGKQSAPASSFVDVPANASYAAAVNWGVANGVTEGFGNNDFQPSKVCSRGEIAAFLYRAYN